MDWSNERYVRFYTRDTVEWLCLSWHARGLFGLLMRVSDRAGVIDLGSVGTKGVAPLVHAPWTEIGAPLGELLEDGCIVHEDLGDGASRLLMPNFLAAQEASQSDAQRQRESRARRRDGVTARDFMGSQGVTGASQSVTGTSQPVTAGHTESHRVTPSVPSVPPIPPMPPEPPEPPAHAREDADQLSIQGTDPDPPKPSKPKKKKRKDALNGESPIQIGWRCWRELYEGAYCAPYVDGGPDGKVMSSITTAALRHAKAHAEHDPADLVRTAGHVEAAVRHWFACFLKDDGNKDFLAEARHPLRMLERDMARFGLPWGKGARETPSRGPTGDGAAEIARAAAIDARAAELREQIARGEPVESLDSILDGVGRVVG